jgi:hypothetical protein
MLGNGGRSMIAPLGSAFNSRTVRHRLAAYDRLKEL